MKKTADTVVDFANREFQNLMNTKVPVPLLDGRRSTICGIRVNLHDYIRDFDIKAKIEAALKKIKINAKYIVTPTAEFVNSKCAMIFAFNFFRICFSQSNVSIPEKYRNEGKRVE